jgi:hypothetical protein
MFFLLNLFHELSKVLGTSLDRLSAKVKDPDQLEAALSGVKQFNKDPNFYTGYAKNFIMKSVKKGSDSDPRVGYIRQVKNQNIQKRVCILSNCEDVY